MWLSSITSTRRFYLISFCRTAIALRGKDGVVFAVEKLVTSKLYEPGTNKRIFTIDRHIGMVGIRWFRALYFYFRKRTPRDTIVRSHLRFLVDDVICLTWRSFIQWTPSKSINWSDRSDEKPSFIIKSHNFRHFWSWKHIFSFFCLISIEFSGNCDKNLLIDLSEFWLTYQNFDCWVSFQFWKWITKLLNH